MAIAVDPQGSLFDNRVTLSGSLDRLVQTRYQAFPDHFQKIMAQLSGRQLEIGACVSPDLNDVQSIVNDDAGRSIFGQGQAVGFSLQIRTGPHVLSNWFVDVRL